MRRKLFICYEKHCLKNKKENIIYWVYGIHLNILHTWFHLITKTTQTDRYDDSHLTDEKMVLEKKPAPNQAAVKYSGCMIFSPLCQCSPAQEGTMHQIKIRIIASITVFFEGIMANINHFSLWIFLKAVLLGTWENTLDFPPFHRHTLSWNENKNRHKAIVRPSALPRLVGMISTHFKVRLTSTSVT